MRWRSNAVGEWAACCSWRRYYIGLNEWYQPDAFGALLLEFLDDIGATRLVRRRLLRRIRRGRRRYHAFVEVMRQVDPCGHAWIQWVRWRFPYPPGDFERIGRPANRPYDPPGESPRVIPVVAWVAVFEFD